MKNFDEYIIEKLKVTNKGLTFGDIYRIYNVNSSVAAIFDPGWFVKKIDDIYIIILTLDQSVCINIRILREQINALTLMKGDKVVELLKKFANLSLFR